MLLVKVTNMDLIQWLVCSSKRMGEVGGKGVDENIAILAILNYHFNRVHLNLVQRPCNICLNPLRGHKKQIVAALFRGIFDWNNLTILTIWRFILQIITNMVNQYKIDIVDIGI